MSDSRPTGSAVHERPPPEGPGAAGETRLLDAVRPWHVFAFVLVYLAIPLTAVFLVDLRNAFGLRDSLESSELDSPMLWAHLFNRHPVEWMQWLLLPVLAFTSGAIAALSLSRGRRGPGMFWLWMGVGASLMLFEDAGDVRHELGEWVDRVFAADREDSWRRSNARIVFEMLYYAVIAFGPVYAVLRYGRHVWQPANARWYLVAGFIAYGIAASGSATRHIGDWYAILGGWVNDHLAGGQMLMVRGETPDWVVAGGEREWMEYHFVDNVIEESLELIGAAALVCGALAFLLYLRRRAGAPRGDVAAGAGPPEPGR